jgi:hypothetical protein
VVRVVVLVELALVVVAVVGGIAGVAVWAKAAEPPIKLSETRKLNIRFMIRVN